MKLIVPFKEQKTSRDRIRQLRVWDSYMTTQPNKTTIIYSREKTHFAGNKKCNITHEFVYGYNNGK